MKKIVYIILAIVTLSCKEVKFDLNEEDWNKSTLEFINQCKCSRVLVRDFVRPIIDLKIRKKLIDTLPDVFARYNFKFNDIEIQETSNQGYFFYGGGIYASNGSEISFDYHEGEGDTLSFSFKERPENKGRHYEPSGCYQDQDPCDVVRLDDCSIWSRYVNGKIHTLGFSFN